MIGYVIKKRKPNLNRLLAFSNPKTDYPPLDFAEAEVKSISQLFSKKEIYTEAAATKTKVMERSYSADIIHFACHGEFNDKQPMQSCLLLAKDNEITGICRCTRSSG